MELVRDKLRPLLGRLHSAHAGLLLQRGLTDWEEGEKNKKRELIDTLTKIKKTDLYDLAFDRWLLLTHNQPERFAQTAVMVEGRLFTGLATGGTLETGVCTHHTYGVPMLPGSGIKGAVRTYAHSVGLEGKYLQVLFGSDEEADAESTASGSLVWHDAWWLEGHEYNEKTPFVGEVITVHHQEYYAESRAVADGTESPVPNQQLAVQGGFYFVIEGDPQWAKFAMDLLKNALFEQGMGAKTASGYGYFKDDTRLQNRLKKRYTELLALMPASGDEGDRLKKTIQSLSADALAEKLSRDKNVFLQTLNIDREDTAAVAALCRMVWELRQQDMSDWPNQGKNKARAYNFVQNNLQ